MSLPSQRVTEAVINTSNSTRSLIGHVNVPSVVALRCANVPYLCNYVTRLSLFDVFVRTLIVVCVIAYILYHHGSVSSHLEPAEISYSTRSIFLITHQDTKQRAVLPRFGIYDKALGN